MVASSTSGRSVHSSRRSARTPSLPLRSNDHACVLRSYQRQRHVPATSTPDKRRSRARERISAGTSSASTRHANVPRSRRLYSARTVSDLHSKDIQPIAAAPPLISVLVTICAGASATRRDSWRRAGRSSVAKRFASKYKVHVVNRASAQGPCRGPARQIQHRVSSVHLCLHRDFLRHENRSTVSGIERRCSSNGCKLSSWARSENQC